MQATGYIAICIGQHLLAGWQTGFSRFSLETSEVAAYNRYNRMWKTFELNGMSQPSQPDLYADDITTMSITATREHHRTPGQPPLSARNVSRA